MYVQYQQYMCVGYLKSELNSPSNSTKSSVGVTHPLLFVPVAGDDAIHIPYIWNHVLTIIPPRINSQLRPLLRAALVNRLDYSNSTLIINLLF